MLKDGWHTINGCRVYVEKNKVLRGVSDDNYRTVYPYRWTKYGVWTNASGIGVCAFRNGMKRDTVIMR